MNKAKAITVLSLMLVLRAASIEISIKTGVELYRFMTQVNDGFWGENELTAKLENDIDMSGITNFSPIGSADNTSFTGVFDGQGHTISNLTITSGETNVGLFGYTNHATIKNVILDDTCSVIADGDKPAYIGSIVGRCIAIEGDCVINRCTSHALIQVKNTVNTTAAIGGAIGLCQVDEFDGGNCKIFGVIATGSIMHTATSTGLVLGGVIGYCIGAEQQGWCNITSSVAANDVIVEGTVKKTGVIGNFMGNCGNLVGYCSIESSVAAGVNPMDISKAKIANPGVGTFTGLMTSTNSYVKDSFVLKSLGNKTVGFGSVSITEIPVNTTIAKPVTIGSTLVSTSGPLIAEYAKNNMLDEIMKIILDRHTIKFVTNSYKSMSDKNVPFPKEVKLANSIPATDNSSLVFDGWYFSDTYLDPWVEPSIVINDITLYAHWIAGSPASVASVSFLLMVAAILATFIF